MLSIKYFNKEFRFLLSLAFFVFMLSSFSIYAQTISFGSSGLIGESVLNPTSLEFGPDGRLYVAQQDGTIWGFTVQRDAAPMGSGTYTITNIEEITILQTGITNHYDSGVSNTTQQR